MPKYYKTDSLLLLLFSLLLLSLWAILQRRLYSDSSYSMCFVAWSVGHTHVSCKNHRGSQDAVWDDGSGEPREPRVRL